MLAIHECDVLLEINKGEFINQRNISEKTGHSLGMVNQAIKSLKEDGYITEDMRITTKASGMINEMKPKCAIILAAGFGLRMIPINLEAPKAFLEVRGERLIERQIKQLRAAGIEKIYIVVGFMKEKFEYLIDEYDVELIVNSEYSVKNNMYSVLKAWNFLDKRKVLKNVYICPCDIWCEYNPFNENELYSWYMVSKALAKDSEVRVNRKGELVRANVSDGNRMIGISYLTEKDVNLAYEQMLKLSQDDANDGLFWEESLYSADKMIANAKIVDDSKYIEINTFEELRELDEDSKQLKIEAIDTISKTLNVDIQDIEGIEALKKGMTNRSFLFSCKGNKYIMRIPGEGTEQLINRSQECDVYKKIEPLNLCDNPLYLNAQNGYKITKFIDGVRVCDPFCEDDLNKCMEKLRCLHDAKLKVGHSFDIYGQIDFYETLRGPQCSVYRDYENTKENVLSLRKFINENEKEHILTHIDANHDNFLFYPLNLAGSNSENSLEANKPKGIEIQNGNASEEYLMNASREYLANAAEGDFVNIGASYFVNAAEGLQLTDWEYAGMQDPDVDIAMFAIYAFYDKEWVDKLIDIYYCNACDIKTRTKIYCYIAACGLLWSNWCEYKSTLGVEFGEYGLRQYRYAKEFYRYAVKNITAIDESV